MARAPSVAVYMSSALSLNDTYGAVLIGTYVSLMQVFSILLQRDRPNRAYLRLYGVALNQAFHYYRTYSHDRAWLKIYVSIRFKQSCSVQELIVLT